MSELSGGIMPAARLTATPIGVGRFDIMGFDAAAPDHVIGHVGLAVNSVGAFSAGQTIGVVHMQPPMAAGGHPLEPQACGSVPCTVDETQRINLFVDEQIAEHEAEGLRWRGYIVRPHAKSEQEADGTTVYRRFSCAGFVVEAYRATELDVVVTDEDLLPQFSLDVIERAYPFVRGHARARAFFGLQGDGPWPVLMPGHILHALDRTTEDIRRSPYQPREGDEFFV